MIIFTDLDNCLLDSEYSVESVKDFINELVNQGIIISIISSKTEAEITYFFERMGISGPYGAENGCIISAAAQRWELGTSSEKIKSILKRYASGSGIEIEFFTEMDNDRIARITGLPREQIPLAKERKYSEPFIVTGEGSESKLFEELREDGYSVRWGGKFYQISGGCSKGDATRRIKKHFSEPSIGIGDSPNDHEMLDETDYKIILNSDGESRYRDYKGYGPGVWKKALKDLLREING